MSPIFGQIHASGIQFWGHVGFSFVGKTGALGPDPIERKDLERATPRLSDIVGTSVLTLNGGAVVDPVGKFAMLLCSWIQVGVCHACLAFSDLPSGNLARGTWKLPIFFDVFPSYECLFTPGISHWQGFGTIPIC